jgi:hypothetical protein
MRADSRLVYLHFPCFKNVHFIPRGQMWPMQQLSPNSQYPPGIWQACQSNGYRSIRILTSKISGARVPLRGLAEIGQLFSGEDIMVSKPTSGAIPACCQVKEVTRRWLLFMQWLEEHHRHATVSSKPTNIRRCVQEWGPHMALVKTVT